MNDKNGKRAASQSGHNADLRFVVAVPVGAWNDYLSATFESLARQTPRPSVALLDASGDPRVAELADSFGELFAYRRHGPDQGQTSAIAEGWRELDGDILHWLNMDDALMPGALAAVQQAFQDNPEADVVYGHSIVLDEDGGLRGAHPAVDPKRLDELPRDCVISQPSCFARREAVERAGGLNNHFHYVMDWDLWTRLYKTGAQFHFLNEFLSQVVWGADTKTADLNLRKLSELFRIVKRTKRPDWIFRTLGAAAKQILIDYHINPIFSRKAFYWRNGTRLPYVNFGRGDAVGIAISLESEGLEGVGGTERLEVFDRESAPIVNGAGKWTLNGAGDQLEISFADEIGTGDPIWIRTDDDALQRRVKRIRWLYDGEPLSGASTRRD